MACLVAVALGSYAVAQSAPNASGTPVHMIVTVEPRKGSEVPVVNREDVVVYEGKNRDSVTEWVPAQGDHAGLEFYVLIDDASSSAVETEFSGLPRG